MRKPSDLAQVTKNINATMQERGAKILPRDLAAQLRADNLKRCPGCATVKNTTDFAEKKSNSDGLQPRCRACNSVDYREFYNKDPQRQVRRVAEYRSRSPLGVRITNGRIRAEKFGAYWEDFNKDDLLAYWESVGIDKDRSVYSGEQLTPETFSIDHVVPLSRPGTPGHRKELLVPCTRSENRRKAAGHWIYLLNNAPDPDAPALVKQALEPGAPGRQRRTLMLTTATTEGDNHVTE